MDGKISKEMEDYYNSPDKLEPTKDMEKYYTPEIEEFHVGFEYESYETIYTHEWDKGTDKWINRVVKDANQVHMNGEPKAIYHINMLNNGEPIKDWNKTIRVKHLDREDIESLGWAPKGSGVSVDNSVTFERFQCKDYMMIFQSDNTVSIYGEWNNCLFTGKLANKSELKKILQWIGV